MDNRLVLVPEEDGANYGRVKPVSVNGGTITYGLSVGTWVVSEYDGRIYVDLYKDIDTIRHEVATQKSVKAELRGDKRNVKVVKQESRIEYDPKTKRLKQVYL